MSVRWSEDALRQVLADIAADAVPDSYAELVADAAAESGIPAAVIDNRFRRERGEPETALRRNAQIQALTAHSARALGELPEGVDLDAWSPATGVIVELGGQSLAFVGYDPYHTGTLFLIDADGALVCLKRDDPRIEPVMQQVSGAFRAKLAAQR